MIKYQGKAGRYHSLHWLKHLVLIRIQSQLEFSHRVGGNATFNSEIALQSKHTLNICLKHPQAGIYPGEMKM